MSAYPVHDLTGYLHGSWDLVRDIVGIDGAALGRFTGKAEFAWQDGELRYHEQGELRLNEHHGNASRTLRYRPDGPTHCDVYFADGHFFHDLRLDTGSWNVGHPCRADHYAGQFTVTSADRWLQHWHVTGPEKAYEMTTTYTRAPRDGSPTPQLPSRP